MESDAVLELLIAEGAMPVTAADFSSLVLHEPFIYVTPQEDKVRRTTLGRKKAPDFSIIPVYCTRKIHLPQYPHLAQANAKTLILTGPVIEVAVHADHRVPRIEYHGLIKKGNTRPVVLDYLLRAPPSFEVYAEGVLDAELFFSLPSSLYWAH